MSIPKLCPFCQGSHHLADDCAPKQAAHKEEADRPFVVCPRCEGHGHHGPGHVYTMDELDERFGADAADVMQDYRDGKYDVVCTECHGRRVIKADCECAECERDRRLRAEAEAEAAAERAFGC